MTKNIFVVEVTFKSFKVYGGVIGVKEGTKSFEKEICSRQVIWSIQTFQKLFCDPQ